MKRIEREVVNIAFQTVDAVTQSEGLFQSFDNNYKNLDKNEKITITVPNSLIVDINADVLRIAIFLLLYVRRGQDNILYISINTIVKWLKRVPNRHKDGINHKVLDTVYYLKEHGYIEFDDSIFLDTESNLNKNVWDVFFAVYFKYDNVLKDISFVNDERKQYATIYWDEVLKIIKFKNTSKIEKFAYKDNPSILFVFCYLRMKIGLKKNNWIAASDMYYKEIAENIGISHRKVSECLNILSELNLIYYENLKAYKLKNGEFRRNTTIFASTYRRGYVDGKPVLLASGEKYYLSEVQQYKKQKLKLND